ncbi:MAG: NAD-dependent epimerase/dehydratase family protein [Patescibacteria group bacterium]
MDKKPALVTGGCGFVGRHLVRALLERGDSIYIIDNLSTGKHPDQWLGGDKLSDADGRLEYRVGEQTVTFIRADLLSYLHARVDGGVVDELPAFGDVFHLASIVGGRALIDGDPMRVATDLGIDAIFFLWATRRKDKIDRLLYASSSAAYPTQLQAEGNVIRLQEPMITFDGTTLGQPDMTYGWSKLTGEYLATIAARQYGMSVACVRPFSGYGEDQDPSYPVPAIALRVARRENPMTVWGTGEQGRDFIHIDDCVAFMLYILDHVHDGRGVNIGTGVLTSFNQLIALLSRIEGYSAEIQQLLDKPVGVHNRVCDPVVMQWLGWKPKITIEEGMRRVLAHAHVRITDINAL